MNSKKAVDRIMKVLGLTQQSFYEAKTEQGMSVKMEGELEIGQIAGLIDEIKPAAGIVNEIISEYKQALNEQNSAKYIF